MRFEPDWIEGARTLADAYAGERYCNAHASRRTGEYANKAGPLLSM